MYHSLKSLFHRQHRRAFRPATRQITLGVENLEDRLVPSGNPLNFLIGSINVEAKYASLGGAQGFLGAPTSAIQQAPDGVGVFQDYKNGDIYWTSYSGAHEMNGLILQKWQAMGGTNFGYPTTDETTTPDGAGRYNHFELQTSSGMALAAIDWTPTTGAHEIHGAIAAKFFSLGAESFFGEAVTDETTTPDGAGRYNHFEYFAASGKFSLNNPAVSAIDWTPETGAHDVYGAIAAKFFSLGAESYGEAVTDTVTIANFTYQGQYNSFERFLDLWGMEIPLTQTSIDWTAGQGGFTAAGPQFSDIVQGGGPTCWILASMAAAEHSDVNLAQRITYEGNNWYSVWLYNFNDPKTRPTGGMYQETEQVYFNGLTTSADPVFNTLVPSQSWVIIMQRAVIQAVSDWDPTQSITNPHGGSAGDALEMLTGKVASYASAQAGNIEQQISSDLANNDEVVLDTKGQGTKTLVADHSYDVLSCNSKTVTLYNPWGFEVTVAWSVISQDGNDFDII
jgi:hypothetical protein